MTASSIQRVMPWILGILLVLSAAVLATRWVVTSDMGVFLPKNESSTTADVLLSQLDKGATANVVFVRLRDETPEKLAQLSRSLGELWLKSDLVTRVLNGTQALDKSDLEFVERHRYLLSPRVNEETFTEASLKASLNDRVRGLSGALAAIEKRFVRQDPTGEMLGLVDAWRSRQARVEGPRKIDGVWFSEDGESAILVLQTKTKGMDLDSHEASMRFLEHSFLEAPTWNATLDLTGAGAFAVETRDVIRADIRKLSILAVALVGLFLLTVFRSLQLVLLLFVPLVCAVVTAAAAVLLVFGNIHGITLAFGITLIGVAIDYPIHFFAHFNNDNTSAHEHVRRIWPTLRLGVLTTMIAYAFLMFSNFEGLQQLGLFTMCGLLMAAAVTRWWLPYLVPARLDISHQLGALHRFFEKGGRRAFRARPLALLAIAAAAVFLLTTERPLRNFQVDALSPIAKSRRVDAISVRNDLKMWSGGQMLVAVGPTQQSVLEFTERQMPALDALVESGAIRAYDMAAQFLPSVATQRKRLDALPDEKTLSERLTAASSGLPFKPGVFEPFLSGVAASRDIKPLTFEDLQDKDLATHLKPLLFAHAGKWSAPVLLHGVKDLDAVNALQQVTGEHEFVPLSLKGETSALMKRVIDRMVILLSMGTLCIYLLLWIAYRDWRRPFRILVPTLASVIVTSAILVLSGVSLNLFHLTALLLVVGLGLDYSLFFSRLPENLDEWQTTFRSLWICCLTTVLVFGLLIVSDTPPLHAVGVTASIGAALSLIFGAVWSSAYGEGHGFTGLRDLMANLAQRK